jgi:hypothetical protein
MAFRSVTLPKSKSEQKHGFLIFRRKFDFTLLIPAVPPGEVPLGDESRSIVSFNVLILVKIFIDPPGGSEVIPKFEDSNSKRFNWKHNCFPVCKLLQGA